VWYDNIPLVSWLTLRGRCRFCSASISWLYPFTEITTALLTTALFHKIIVVPYSLPDIDIAIIPEALLTDAGKLFLTYFIFVSALIAATRTDLESLLIPQLFTLWMIPAGLLAAWFHFTNVSLTQSIMGALIGYGMLWVIAWTFHRVTGKDGLGVGDMELLAMIGAFLGPLGAWITLVIGSVSGLIAGSCYLALSGKTRSTQIPFGPFLALGACTYLLWGTKLAAFLLGMSS
jgi:leader peptidase (prepilin peptidase)/N-methyltransferase